MALDDTTLRTIRAFLKSEETAPPLEGSGEVWTGAHHIISPAAGKLAGALPEDERRRFYLHYMRLSGTVPTVPEAELPLLAAAYGDLLPVIDTHRACYARRHQMLLLFGYDESGPLPGEPPLTGALLKARLKLRAYLASFSNLPGQRAKIATLATHAEQAPRILAILRRLGYQHDQRPDIRSYDALERSFWGMVLILLTHPQTRPEVVTDMLVLAPGLPEPEQHLSVFRQAVAAARPLAGADETAFLEAADRLDALQQAKQDAAEPTQLATRLGIALPGEADWTVALALDGRRGSDDYRLDLTLRSDPVSQWHVQMRGGPANHGFAIWTGKMLGHNGLKVANLEAGKLSTFPEWLKALEAQTGIAFDRASAKVYAGRNRGAAKILKAWIA